MFNIFSWEWLDQLNQEACDAEASRLEAEQKAYDTELDVIESLLSKNYSSLRMIDLRGLNSRYKYNR